MESNKELLYATQKSNKQDIIDDMKSCVVQVDWILSNMNEQSKRIKVLQDELESIRIT